MGDNLEGRTRRIDLRDQLLEFKFAYHCLETKEEHSLHPISLPVFFPAAFRRHFKRVLKTLGIDVPQRQRWLQLVSEDEATQILSDAPGDDQRRILLPSRRA